VHVAYFSTLQKSQNFNIWHSIVQEFILMVNRKPPLSWVDHLDHLGPFAMIRPKSPNFNIDYDGYILVKNFVSNGTQLKIFSIFPEKIDKTRQTKWKINLKKSHHKFIKL
jgi:hypothetical protein